MKKRLIMAGISVIFMLISVNVFADYNKEAVVKVMRENGALMGELKQAAQNGDYFAAAEALMGIAKGMKSLDAIAPLKGSKAEWDRIHGELINAAFKGIGACGERNGEKLNKYINEVGALIGKGHGMFR
ncbi:MAG: hypothetical protein JSV25_08150 [Spirochaetota bacterium]|nr:MAG: hypothetical protein JSV25_08150 [Spirochaetota bacterium]